MTEAFNLSSSSMNTITQCMEHITTTCDALIMALEVNSESVGNYGGGIVHEFNNEHVDQIVNALLKIRYHMIRMQKELNLGLIKSGQDMECIMSGLLGMCDNIDSLLQKNGFLRNTFAFAMDEIKSSAQCIMEEVKIGVLV